MKITAYLLFTLLVLQGCKEEDPGFTSLIGSWAYVTPDGNIAVTFDITAGTSSVLAVGNPTIEVVGVSGKSEIQTTNITERIIDQIRINANDASLTYPYNIVFNKLKASNDFSVIDVEEVTYTYPWPETKTLSSIQIIRK